MSLLKSTLQYNKEEDIDSPETTIRRRELIKSKPFLRKIYEQWYADIITGFKNVPKGDQIEIGSGGGFLKDIYPQAITSDLLPLPFVDKVFAAEEMPYENNTVSGICMVNVLHHIPECRKFFSEANRVLKPGGKIIMVEPATCWWSRFIFGNFHHEPFEVNAARWEIDSTGPLSGANGALPWILFFRDRAQFEKEFPDLEIKSVKHHTPITYLISGGVSMRSMVPDFSYGFFRFLESLTKPFSKYFCMFMTVEVRKKG
jgi:SAM-dependent methyltransferase